MPPVLQTWAARGPERRHGSLQSSPSLAGSHPLKFPRFSNGLCVPRLPGGRFFAQSSAHLFAVLCANRRTSAQTSRTAPICCIFLQQTPSFCPMGERPFSHPPTPSHDRDPPLKHFEMRVRLRRAWRAGPGSIREPLLQASCALRPSAPEPSFPYAHTPRPHLENLTPPKPAHTGRPVASPRSFSLTIPLHTPIIVSYGTERYFFNERSPLYDPRPAPCGAAQFSL